jgi:hypothetical protein
MYRGLSDYLGRTNFFHSSRLKPVPSNITPFGLGNFMAPPGPDDTSGLGSMQSDSQSVQIIGSLTAASSNDEGEEKAPDENV